MAYWIDDGFDTWPEVVRAGSAAAGLYVRCGSWIARNLTDGFVPAEVAAMYGTPEWVAKLVTVGLWSTEQAGYRDVRYHQMGNPTAEKVAERRAADADRQARWRERQHASRRDERVTRRGTHNGTDAVTPRSPALPPLKGEGQQAAPATRARAAPAPNPNPVDCPLHLGQPAHNCANCRSERLALTGPTGQHPTIPAKEAS